MFNANNPWGQLQMMGQRPTAFPGQGTAPTNGAWAGGSFAPPGLQNRPTGFPGQGAGFGGQFPGQGAPVQGGFPGAMRPNMGGPMQPMGGMPYGRRPLAP